MIQRQINPIIREMAAKMPIISITGPRQSGKTTVSKLCFPEHDYVNLENPDTLEEAKSDPRSFLTRHRKGLIIDEAQLMPELFSYIQTLSDESGKTGEYILTGSQHFLLSAKISQSLAGRVFITHLLPFSISELHQAGLLAESPLDHMLKGFYPRIYDKDIKPFLFYPSYIQTYTERDVRQIIHVSNLFLFQKFMRLAAGRVGQLLNYNSIATEVGVDLKTIKSWFSILEASFVVFFLQPHHRNFSKRILKSPKLYFYDTGMACSLLGIKETEELTNHWAKSALFENMILADFVKNYFNRGESSPLFFWRDHTGHEVDCLIDDGLRTKSIEIKSGTTALTEHFKGLKYYSSLSGTAPENSFLLYGGERESIRAEGKVVSWKNTSEITKR